MKSAFVSLALATGLASSLAFGPAMAATSSKPVAPQAVAGHAPYGWNTGLIDGSIKLRPTPPTGLASGSAAPAAAHMVTAHATQAQATSLGTAPNAATQAGPGALPYLAASMALLAFLALRLRRGA